MKVMLSMLMSILGFNFSIAFGQIDLSISCSTDTIECNPYMDQTLPQDFLGFSVFGGVEPYEVMSSEIGLEGNSCEWRYFQTFTIQDAEGNEVTCLSEVYEVDTSPLAFEWSPSSYDYLYCADLIGDLYIDIIDCNSPINTFYESMDIDNDSEFIFNYESNKQDGWLPDSGEPFVLTVNSIDMCGNEGEFVMEIEDIEIDIEDMMCLDPSACNYYECWIWECFYLGDACDDYNPNTIDDQFIDDCQCQGFFSGDFNQDGVVSTQDLSDFLNAFGNTCEEGAPCPYDINGDDSVSALDLSAFLTQFGLSM